MPLTSGWPDIALRLLLTVIAAGLIGYNRGEQGHPAGLRTTILVCLAASLSMILANLWLDTRGKPNDSFVVLDLMRLPLGILSGIGFIGAGAIVKRGTLIEGVTTAATLWFVTTVGLCFGGGALVLGIIATALGLFVLTVLKRLEARLPAEHRATLELTLEGDGTAGALFADLSGQGYRIMERGAWSEGDSRLRHFRYELQWRGPEGDAGPAESLKRFAGTPGIVRFSWRIGVT